jgi:hypothetical protein
MRRTMKAMGAEYIILHRDWPLEGSAPDRCEDRPAVETIQMLLDAAGFEMLTATSDVIIYTPPASHLYSNEGTR